MFVDFYIGLKIINIKLNVVLFKQLLTHKSFALLKWGDIIRPMDLDLLRLQKEALLGG